MLKEKQVNLVMFPCVFYFWFLKGKILLLIGVKFTRFSQEAEIYDAKQKALFGVVLESRDETAKLAHVLPSSGHDAPQSDPAVSVSHLHSQ